MTHFLQWATLALVSILLSVTLIGPSDADEFCVANEKLKHVSLVVKPLPEPDKPASSFDAIAIMEGAAHVE